MRLVIRILKFPLAYLGEDGLFKFRLGVSAIVIGTNRFSTRSDFITIGDNEKKSSHSAAAFFSAAPVCTSNITFEHLGSCDTQHRQKNAAAAMVAMGRHIAPLLPIYSQCGSRDWCIGVCWACGKLRHTRNAHK